MSVIGGPDSYLALARRCSDYVMRAWYSEWSPWFSSPVCPLASRRQRTGDRSVSGSLLGSFLLWVNERHRRRVPSRGSGCHGPTSERGSRPMEGID